MTSFTDHLHTDNCNPVHQGRLIVNLRDCLPSVEPFPEEDYSTLVWVKDSYPLISYLILMKK